MAPPAKKQKVDNPKSPIIFQSPGLKPDVSLKVFDVEFHVTSASTNITANADVGNGSPSMTPPEASATHPSMVFGDFKYKWVTEVDEDEKDKWHIVADNPKNEPFDLGTFTGNKTFHAEVFENLLCALYLRPYSIDGITELTNLTNMADFYRMLPIVSYTLSNALLDSQEFVNAIKTNPCAVFEAAAKLRHKVLFREALVWVVGSWMYPGFKQLSNPRLRQVARCVYGEIATMVSKSTGRIVDASLAAGCTEWLGSFGDGVIDPQQEEHWDADDMYLSERPTLNLPKFFRNIVRNDGLPSDIAIDPLYLSDLLKNNLVLDLTGRLAGEDDEKDYFLCAKIEDEDLPWDPNELDW